MVDINPLRLYVLPSYTGNTAYWFACAVQEKFVDG